MNPEEKAQLRQLLRKSQQLPQPPSQLFRRATKKMSRAGQLLKKDEVEKSINQQKRNAQIAQGRKKR